jgi:hypothetical protein
MDASMELPLLKSFGVQSSSESLDLFLRQQGTSENPTAPGYQFGGLSIALTQFDEAAIRQLLPLYGQISSSKVNFAKSGNSFFLTDLLSPAIQALVWKFVRFNDSAIQLKSHEALLSVLISDGTQVRFSNHEAEPFLNFLFDGRAFKTAGEIILASQSSAASRWERNSGFSVGDLLIFTGKNAPRQVLHAALWLDHDVYFEVVPASGKFVFRIASFAQILEELTPRMPFEVSQLRLSILRRNASWVDIAKGMSALRQQKSTFLLPLSHDSLGRGQAASPGQGLVLGSVLDPK